MKSFQCYIKERNIFNLPEFKEKKKYYGSLKTLPKILCSFEQHVDLP